MAAVLDYLQGRGVTFQVIPHAPASSAQEAAAIIGVDPAEMANTIPMIEGLDVSLAVSPRLTPSTPARSPRRSGTAPGPRTKTRSGMRSPTSTRTPFLRSG